MLSICSAGALLYVATLWSHRFRPDGRRQWIQPTAAPRCELGTPLTGALVLTRNGLWQRMSWAMVTHKMAADIHGASGLLAKRPLMVSWLCVSWQRVAGHHHVATGGDGIPHRLHAGRAVPVRAGTPLCH
jgi:hypothetical protein